MPSLKSTLIPLQNAELYTLDDVREEVQQMWREPITEIVRLGLSSPWSLVRTFLALDGFPPQLLLGTAKVILSIQRPRPAQYKANLVDAVIAALNIQNLETRDMRLDRPAILRIMS
jgi:hypothetical protein